MESGVKPGGLLFCLFSAKTEQGGKMKTLHPSAHFLRVADKFFGDFILRDPAVSTGQVLLYLLLFRSACQSGVCRSSQFSLARACKCSVRTIQHYLRGLAALQYIEITQQEDGRNVYRLLLSQRVQSFIDREDVAGMPDVSGPEPAQYGAKNFRIPGEEFSPIYKKEKKYTIPPTPHSPEQRSARASSCTASKTSSHAVPALPQQGGWGDSFQGKVRKGHSFQAANEQFERFYKAYPRKEAKEPARAAWHRLWRHGLLPALDVLMAALEKFRTSAMWLKENGRFVPYLFNWLKGQRWLDELSDAGATVTPEEKTRQDQAQQTLAHIEKQEQARQARHEDETARLRPEFEKFLSRFSDGSRKRGPAWGLWSVLHRRGKAPKASDVPSDCGLGVYEFLKECTV